MRLELQANGVRQLSRDERRRLSRLTVGRESYMVSVLEDNPDTARCWVARWLDRIVAWSLLRWFSPDVQASHNAYISVFVDVDARGKGIGRKLVQTAMDEAEAHGLHPCFYAATRGQHTFYRACGAPAGSITRDAFPRNYWAHCRFVKNGLRAR